jgi:hypothetical protein
MAQSSLPSDAELHRIYATEIRPYYLDTIKPSQRPTVVFVAGAPGAGITALVPHIAARLAAATGDAVVVSVDALREHHPAWRQPARSDTHAADRFTPAANRWAATLYAEAMAQRKNVVFETTMTRAHTLQDVAATFRTAGYRVEAEVLAVDAERTKRAVIGRALAALDKGLAPRHVSAARHDEGHARLRATLQVLETKQVFDHIRIVRRDGQEQYRNEVVSGTWSKPPAAVQVLDRECAQRLTTAELAQNAIAWHQLSTRAQLGGGTPARIIGQALAWSKEAAQRALRDPEAAKQYAALRAGECFRKLPREQFLREFPAYAGAVERLNAAMTHGSRQLTDAAQREVFIATTRERLARQIEGGRQFGRIKVSEETMAATRGQKDHDPPTR